MKKSAVVALVLGFLLPFAPRGASAGPAVVYPLPIPSPDYGDFSVTHGVSELSLGQTVTATWTAAPAGGSDWVGLYEAGATDVQYRAFCYTGGSATGNCGFQPPTAGTWELRYYLGNPAYTLVAVSSRFTVVDRCASVSRTLRLIGPLVGGGGRRLDVAWSVEPAECAAGNDWVGLYATGAANTQYLGYFYTGAGSGTQSVYAPAAPGSYEFRFLPKGAYESAARTGSFAVVACAAGDGDCDGRPDASDRCPYFAESDPALDTDADGRGDECECTDQNGDGRNSVADLVAINQAVFDPTRAGPLCDGNNDSRCDVQDIVAAQREIFSPGQTSTCSRHPFLP